MARLSRWKDCLPPVLPAFQGMKWVLLLLACAAGLLVGAEHPMANNEKLKAACTAADWYRSKKVLDGSVSEACKKCAAGGSLEPCLAAYPKDAYSLKVRCPATCANATAWPQKDCSWVYKYLAADKACKEDAKCQALQVTKLPATCGSCVIKAGDPNAAYKFQSCIPEPPPPPPPSKEEFKKSFGKQSPPPPPGENDCTGDGCDDVGHHPGYSSCDEYQAAFEKYCDPTLGSEELDCWRQAPFGGFCCCKEDRTASTNEQVYGILVLIALVIVLCCLFMTYRKLCGSKKAKSSDRAQE